MDEEFDSISVSDLPLWANVEANEILRTVCAKYLVPVDIIAELVAVQRERQHQERAHGINARFEEILGLII